MNLSLPRRAPNVTGAIATRRALGLPTPIIGVPPCGGNVGHGQFSRSLTAHAGHPPPC